MIFLYFRRCNGRYTEHGYKLRFSLATERTETFEKRPLKLIFLCGLCGKSGQDKSAVYDRAWYSYSNKRKANYPQDRCACAALCRREKQVKWTPLNITLEF